MPRRQRDFKQEYADRQARSRARGFTGYSQERKARKEIRGFLESKVRRGQVASVPGPRDPKFELLVRARARVIKQSKTFVRGKQKLSPELKAELREAFPEEGEYWSAVKSLYE